MALFKVCIEARVIKTYEVDASSEAEAISKAHEVFDVGVDSVEESLYEEVVLNVCEAAS